MQGHEGQSENGGGSLILTKGKDKNTGQKKNRKRTAGACKE